MVTPAGGVPVTLVAERREDRRIFASALLAAGLTARLDLLVRYAFVLNRSNVGSSGDGGHHEAGHRSSPFGERSYDKHVLSAGLSLDF